MHFCENPHEVFSYYAPGTGNRFCEVEADELSPEKENDSKRACKKLAVKAEINVFQICRIAVQTFFQNFEFDKKLNSAETNNTGNYGAANAGDGGAANAGDGGAANAGNYGAANAGDGGAANAGDGGAANAGDGGAANAGYRGAANAGNYGAANAGYRGAASVEKDGVAICSTCGRVKGGIGSILVLVNRDVYGRIIEAKMEPVDGERIKANTWYRLENGEFKELQ